MTTNRLWPAVFGAWALAAAVLCLVSWPAIAGLRFPDPDDAMRLLEVRDWLAGQSWWDVTQHRLNGGHFVMHWSRLVDLPLAFVMVVADQFTTPLVSDQATMTVVPLATLLAVMYAVAAITQRLGGREEAKLALLLTPLSIPLVYQVRPMRIDHHGWQVALALAALVALVGPATTKRGVAAGAALAALLTISLEGLPIAAIIAGACALAWAVDPTRRNTLRALLVTLFCVGLVLHGLTRGPAAWTPSCDAMSPAWIATLGVAALLVAITCHFAPPTIIGRVGALLLSGAGAGVVLLALAPDCAHGPFATLDPLVRTLWYEQVTEGLPLWEQPLVWAVITVAVPLTGIVATILALRASDGELRVRWAVLLTVLVPVFVLSCLVNRCGATANALALPGAASLLLKLLTRSRAIVDVPRRTLATAGSLLIASPGLIAAAALAHVGARTPSVIGVAGTQRAPCDRFDQVRALAQLPAGTVLLPIDVTPDLIATTYHHAISGGYHRNVEAMHRVLAAFTASPAAAEQIVRASGADYVAGCPDLNETRLYDAVAPRGLWARLESGERIAWLRPRPIHGSPVLAWRVVPSS